MALKYQLRAFWIDGCNRLKYGPQAPRYAERIWIRPSDCSRYIEARDLTDRLGGKVRQMSGKVVEDWPSDLEQPFENHPKLTYCWAHWCDGKDWQEAGAIDFLLGKIAISPTGITDQCSTPEEVWNRYRTLDLIWEGVKAQGYFPTRQELDSGNYREVGGILMHLGPGGEPIFSGAGCHRFAMAMLLDRPFPAQIGCVHTSALESLSRFRSAE